MKMEFVIKKFNIEKRAAKPQKRSIKSGYYFNEEGFIKKGDVMKTYNDFMKGDEVKEAMVAGDSGGDPVKIASGETSGAVIRGTKKKKKDGEKDDD